jgi:hypothetical protein
MSSPETQLEHPAHSASLDAATSALTVNGVVATGTTGAAMPRTREVTEMKTNEDVQLNLEPSIRLA